MRGRCPCAWQPPLPRVSSVRVCAVCVCVSLVEASRANISPSHPPCARTVLRRTQIPSAPKAARTHARALSLPPCLPLPLPLPLSGRVCRLHDKHRKDVERKIEKETHRVQQRVQPFHLPLIHILILPSAPSTLIPPLPSLFPPPNKLASPQPHYLLLLLLILPHLLFPMRPQAPGLLRQGQAEHIAIKVHTRLIADDGLCRSELHLRIFRCNVEQGTRAHQYKVALRRLLHLCITLLHASGTFKGDVPSSGMVHGFLSASFLAVEVPDAPWTGSCGLTSAMQPASSCRNFTAFTSTDKTLTPNETRVSAASASKLCILCILLGLKA